MVFRAAASSASAGASSSSSISASANSGSFSSTPSIFASCDTVKKSSALLVGIAFVANCLLLLLIGTSNSFRKPSRTIDGEAAPQFSQMRGIAAKNSRISPL